RRRTSPSPRRRARTAARAGASAPRTTGAASPRTPASRPLRRRCPERAARRGAAWPAPPRWVRSRRRERSQPQPPQRLAVALVALRRRAQPATHALLHRHPVGVALLAQEADDAAQVHAALAELAEDAGGDRLRVVAPLGAAARGHAGVTVLQVHVQPAVPEAL